MRTFKTLAICLALLLPAVDASAQTNKITFKENVVLAVGQSAVVHGARGDCGQAPVKSEITLPKLKTGTLSLGKPGTRDSNSCGGPTPAIEVIFTATTKGRESFALFGDKVTVRVK